MANLNVDVAALVCEEVKRPKKLIFHVFTNLSKIYWIGAKPDLLTLAEVSVLWNAAVRPWLYRSVTLDFDSTKALGTARLIKSLLSADQRSTPSNYVRFLEITMQSPGAGDFGRRRLQPNVLKAITRLVTMLPNLAAFKWSVREPVPESLFEALRSQPRLAERTAMLTFWGLNEERVYIENLSAWDDITALAVEYRPRADVESSRMIELLTYNQQLLNRPSLKELSISYKDLYNSRFRDVVQMHFGERIAPVEHLSLDYYQFPHSHRGLQHHINSSHLRRLTLTDCEDFDRLLHELSGRVELKEFTLWRPIYHYQNTDVQYFRLIRFLKTQAQLEVLDLEHIGLQRSVTPLILNGMPLRSLRFHDIEDKFSVNEAGDIAEPIRILKSIDATTLDLIAVACPRLTSLSIDLSQVDIKTTSDALNALACNFLESLKHLEITTVFNTQAIDPNHRQMTNDRVYHIAFAVWPATLTTLRIKVETVVGEPHMRGKTGSWLVSRDCMTGDLIVVDEVVTAKERKFRAWKRALGPISSSLSKEDSHWWERILAERMVSAGAKALKGFK